MVVGEEGLASAPTKVVRGRHGFYVVHALTTHGRCIEYYGEHGENELSFVAKFISPGDLVFDVGAHQGAHTLFFARAVGPKGCVVSVEPQRLIFQYLCATVALNALPNVFAYNVGMGEAEGIARLQEYDYTKFGAPSQLSLSAANTGEMVSLITLDRLMQFVAPRRPAFLKIDVEGLESSVLCGGQEILRNFQPVVYFECHPGTENSARAIALLKGLKYSVFLHQPKGFNPDNFFKKEKDIFSGGRDFNAIAVPPSRRELIPADLVEV